MVATARDGSGFDVERDAQPLEGEQPALFEAFTALWRRIELADLPGFYFWQKQAFELLHTHFEELASIFFECAPPPHVPFVTSLTQDASRRRGAGTASATPRAPNRSPTRSRCQRASSSRW